MTQLSEAFEAVEAAEPGLPLIHALGVAMVLLQASIDQLGAAMPPDVLAAYSHQLAATDELIFEESQKLDPATLEMLLSDHEHAGLLLFAAPVGGAQ